MNSSESTIESIEGLRDKIENLRFSINMPLPAKVHLEAMKEVMPEMLEDINSILKSLEVEEKENEHIKN